MPRRLPFLCLAFLLAACGETVGPGKDARILLLGDSLMASNRTSGKAVANVIEQELGEEVIDRSVPAARYFYALPISGSAGLRLTSQFRPGPWDVVVLNGGGNDLLFGCGCGPCETVLDRLVSKDGRAGTIPAFVDGIRKSGARVIYVGYLRNPGSFTPIRACRQAGDELDRRLALMSRFDAGVTFLPMSDLVPEGDTGWHQLDRIHPSPRGSRGIGLRIANEVRAIRGRP